MGIALSYVERTGSGTSMTSTESPPRRLTRRAALLLGVAASVGRARVARAFGEEGAFNPRVLLTGTARFTGLRARAPARWSTELMRRTRAPARLTPTTVRADDLALLDEPFALWTGAAGLEPLTRGEVVGLRRFFALGG